MFYTNFISMKKTSHSCKKGTTFSLKGDPEAKKKKKMTINSENHHFCHTSSKCIYHNLLIEL